MSKLIWDKIGERFYETGVCDVALYIVNHGKYNKGIAWSGVVSIDENPSGAELSPFYADNIKYLNLMSAEDFGITIGAYAYPNEFETCIGKDYLIPGVVLSQQRRTSFGLVYKTIIGNDNRGNDFGYKLHILFNCTAIDGSKSYSSINSSTEPIEHSFEISTNVITIDEYKPFAALVLDSTKIKREGLLNVLQCIEKILYGSDDNEPRFLNAIELQQCFQKQMYLMDSNNEAILDGFGEKIRSFVDS